MDDSALVGLALWVLISYPVWSPRCRRKRKAKGVSGNGASPSTRKTGPAWEQDELYPEIFMDEEDDL